MSAPTPTQVVLAAVEAERALQVAKWGIQTHPDVHVRPDGDDASWVGMDVGSLEHAAANETTAKLLDAAQRRWVPSGVSWTAVLQEEVAEAVHQACLARLPGGDSAGLRYELVQVAAVAVAWVEDLDRRAAGVEVTSPAELTPMETLLRAADRCQGEQPLGAAVLAHLGGEYRVTVNVPAGGPRRELVMALLRLAGMLAEEEGLHLRANLKSLRRGGR